MSYSKPLNFNAEPYSPGNNLKPYHGLKLIPYSEPAVLGHPALYLPHYWPQPIPYFLVHVQNPVLTLPQTTKSVSEEKPASSEIKRARNSVGGGDSSVRISNNLPFPMDFEALKLSGKTTVMVKNIPNHFRRRDLIRILNRHCRLENNNAFYEKTAKSEYDFLYLPMDFNKFWHEKRTANLGYAFVNFTECVGAWRFHSFFNNLSWQSTTSNKTCEVTLAKTQGRVALEDSFRTKLFYCHTDEYLPLVFKPACNGFGSRFLARTVGRRVPNAPRHAMKKSA